MWGDDIKSLRSNNQVFDWYVYFDATLVCREYILALAAGLHSMNPTWSSSSSTVSHSKQQKKSSAVCHLVFLSSPLLSVTSSLYPPRHPTALPEFCWDHRYGESGDNAEEKNKKRLTCAGLISHNPPTLEPAVSSYSPPPPLFFCFLHFTQLCPTFKFLSFSSVPAASCPTYTCEFPMCCTWKWLCTAALLYNVM